MISITAQVDTNFCKEDTNQVGVLPTDLIIDNILSKFNFTPSLKSVSTKNFFRAVTLIFSWLHKLGIAKVHWRYTGGTH